MKYVNWEVGNDSGVRRMPTGEMVEVSLKRSRRPHRYEGWWPADPFPMRPRVVISGMCLWDARWKGRLMHSQKEYSFALSPEREEFFQNMRKGYKQISSIQFPFAPSLYHALLARWQAEKIQWLKPERVLYHLPIDEYHFYVAEIEVACSRQLPVLHHALDEFSREVRDLFLSELPSEFRARVEFVRPMKIGNLSPEESFVYPYLHPGNFDCNPEEVLGIEDLIELRLSWEAARVSGVKIPVLFTVLGIPHPFLCE